MFDFEFWAKKQEWPRDQRGFVFLARAVEKLVAHTHGERSAALFFRRPYDGQFSDRNPANRMDIWFFLKANDEKNVDYPELESLDINNARDSLMFKFLMNQDINLDNSLSAARKLNDEIIDAQSKAIDVCREISRMIADGEIDYGTRAVSGGEFERESYLGRWNTESIDHLFNTCIIYDQKKIMEPVWKYVYVCESKIKKITFENVENKENHEYISKYIQLMMDISTQLGVSQENQPKKDSLVLTIIEEWQRRFPASEPLSANLAKAMATLIRDPESQAGRAKRK